MLTNMRTSVASAVVLVVAIVTPVTAMATLDPGQSPGPSQPVLCDGHAHLHTAQQHARWTKRLFRGYSVPKWAKRKHRHAVKCAVGPSHRLAMWKRWRKVKQSILPRNHDTWVRIARCEQPGSGYKGVNWSHKGPTYQGGLGFWYGTWTSFKFPSMPSNAGYATWRQQMKVANRLYDRYGLSPWGCA